MNRKLGFSLVLNSSDVYCEQFCQFSFNYSCAQLLSSLFLVLITLVQITELMRSRYVTKYILSIYV